MKPHRVPATLAAVCVITLKTRRPPAMEWIPSLATALIGVAAMLRVAAVFADAHAVDFLLLAAACWSGGFVAVFWLVQRCVLASVGRAGAPGDPTR